MNFLVHTLMILLHKKYKKIAVRLHAMKASSLYVSEKPVILLPWPCIYMQIIMGVLCLLLSAAIIIHQCMYCSSLASKCQFNSIVPQSNINEINIIDVTGNFIEIPLSVTIEVEDGVMVDAVFRCRHQRIEAGISWLINGSSSRLYRDVVDDFIQDSNGTRVDTLTIPATPEYNGTEVVCVATFFDGSPHKVTPPADLIIIGML